MRIASTLPAPLVEIPRCRLLDLQAIVVQLGFVQPFLADRHSLGRHEASGSGGAC